MSNTILFSYLNKIENKIQILKKRVPTNCLIAYRGEDLDYKQTKLMPSIYRKSKGSIVDSELSIRSFLKDYKIVNSQIEPINSAIEAQHYGLNSRLLDITFNSLIALFFIASNPFNQTKDGVLYVFAFPEYFSPNDDKINALYDKVISKELIVDRNFKVLKHCWANERVKAQNGGFILFLGEKPTIIPKVYYEPITVYLKDYEDIKNGLKEMFGITQFTIYPEKDKLSTIYSNDEKISKYSTDFDGQIYEYLDRLKYELDYTSVRVDKLRLLRAAKQYIDDLGEKVKNLNIDEKDKKSYLNVIKVAQDYLLIQRKKVEVMKDETRTIN